MHARHQGNAVHSRGKTHKISAARTQAILSSIPRDKTDLIGNLGKDWAYIEAGVIASVRDILQLSLRIYGHGAITEDLPQLLQQPDEYPEVAHKSYIKHVTADSPLVLRASQIRQLFTGIEFSDDDMRSIMRSAAARIERTPDEPKLAVVAADGDIVITFTN